MKKRRMRRAGRRGEDRENVHLRQIRPPIRPRLVPLRAQLLCRDHEDLLCSSLVRYLSLLPWTLIVTNEDEGHSDQDKRGREGTHSAHTDLRLPRRAVHLVAEPLDVVHPVRNQYRVRAQLALEGREERGAGGFFAAAVYLHPLVVASR